MRAELTCGEVDVGEQDDVSGDEGNEFSDADLLLEVDVDHVVVSQAAVGRGVKLLQAGPQAAKKTGRMQNTVRFNRQTIYITTTHNLQDRNL